MKTRWNDRHALRTLFLYMHTHSGWHHTYIYYTSTHTYTHSQAWGCGRLWRFKCRSSWHCAWLYTEGMVRTLSVSVTASLVVTRDQPTPIDTVSTGGFTALGVQFRVEGVPTINWVNWMDQCWHIQKGLQIWTKQEQLIHTFSSENTLWRLALYFQSEVACS